MKLNEKFQKGAPTMLEFIAILSINILVDPEKYMYKIKFEVYCRCIFGASVQLGFGFGSRIEHWGLKFRDGIRLGF